MLLHHWLSCLQHFVSREDPAIWKEFTARRADFVRTGVNVKRVSRPAETGNTHESLETYRDPMLIKRLKLHKPLELLLSQA